MINHILCSLPEEYDAKVEYLQNKIDEKEEISLNKVMDALRTKYNLICQRKNKRINLNEDEAPALFVNNQAFRGKKQYKGTCRICGKYGHKAEDCLHNEKIKEIDPTTTPTKTPTKIPTKTPTKTPTTTTTVTQITLIQTLGVGIAIKLGTPKRNAKKRKRDM